MNAEGRWRVFNMIIKGKFSKEKFNYTIIKGAKGKPVYFEDKEVGEVISAKINPEGELVLNMNITSKITKRDMLKKNCFSINELGDDK